MEWFYNWTHPRMFSLVPYAILIFIPFPPNFWLFHVSRRYRKDEGTNVYWTFACGSALSQFNLHKYFIVGTYFHILQIWTTVVSVINGHLKSYTLKTQLRCPWIQHHPLLAQTSRLASLTSYFSPSNPCWFALPWSLTSRVRESQIATQTLPSPATWPDLCKAQC